MFSFSYNLARLCICLLVVLVFSPQMLNAQNAGDDVVIGKYRKMNSKIFNEEITFLEHLPGDYEKSAKKYPVLYVLNAQMTSNFALAASTLDRLSFEQIPEMILIGISNTGAANDYWPLHPRTKEPGGADKFLEFLYKEFIPFIDQSYRTHNFKILMGQSNTGLFTVYAFLDNSDSFDVFIASSPMLGWCIEYLQQKNIELTTDKRNETKKLYITYGEFDYKEYVNDHIQTFIDFLEQYAPEYMKWNVNYLEKEGHVPLTTLNNCLLDLFSGYVVPENTKSEGILAVENYYYELTRKYGFDIAVPEEVYFNMAYQMIKENNLAGAINIFKTLVHKYPHSARAHFFMGHVYQQQGDIESARQKYQDALQMDPDYEAARKRLDSLNSKQ